MDPETAGQYYNNTNTWVEFRYAEILLNYAEACIELAFSDKQLICRMDLMHSIW